MSRLDPCGASVPEETRLCGWRGSRLCRPREPFWLCTPLAGRPLCSVQQCCVFCQPCCGLEGASTVSSCRDRQMCCSAIPENNSLVWERALHSAGSGTEAASPSSINVSASSTNLRLCCCVVSALAGDRNLETDFYSLDEVSVPPGMDPGETSQPGVSQEEDVGCQWLSGRAGSALLEL